MKQKMEGAAPELRGCVASASEVVRVHLGYKRCLSRGKGPYTADTRCGTGDRRSITWNLAECNCPLCLYWAKRGHTKDTWEELYCKPPAQKTSA